MVFKLLMKIGVVPVDELEDELDDELEEDDVSVLTNLLESNTDTDVGNPVVLNEEQS